jgi:hypothetical protein
MAALRRCLFLLPDSAIMLLDYLYTVLQKTSHRSFGLSFGLYCFCYYTNASAADESFR